MEKLRELVSGYPGLISLRLINRGMTKINRWSKRGCGRDETVIDKIKDLF
jgi:hypothetical protein